MGSAQLQKTAVNGNILALRDAQIHLHWPKQLHEKSNSLQEILNLQQLHTTISSIRRLFIYVFLFLLFFVC